LNRQSGVVNFEPLKPLFIAGYRAAHVYFSPNAALPPLQLHIRRNPDVSSPTRVLPVARTLKAATQDFQAACKFVSAYKLPEAVAAFRNLLHLLLLTVANDQEETLKVCSRRVVLFLFR
jgi:coatomer protein complex subunit alpha (xenin)